MIKARWFFKALYKWLLFPKKLNIEDLMIPGELLEIFLGSKKLLFSHAQFKQINSWLLQAGRLSPIHFIFRIFFKNKIGSEIKKVCLEMLNILDRAKEEINAGNVICLINEEMKTYKCITNLPLLEVLERRAYKRRDKQSYLNELLEGLADS